MSSPALLRRLLGALLAGIAVFGVARLPAQDAVGSGWHYRLMNGSYLLDDCLICGRPSVMIPMQGTFTLRLRAEHPISTTYALENIDFTASEQYRVKGEGEITISGEVALIQMLKLDVRIETVGETVDARLESESTPPPQRWPMLFSETTQTNGTFIHTFSLGIAAAPLRDLWFSTRHGFTGGRDPNAGVRISDGDLLSIDGHVVRTQQQLRAAFGISPTDADLGLDSVTVVRGGLVAFSTRDSLGGLRDGDWVDEAGSVRARYEDLLAPFSVTPPVPAVGLKAVVPFDTRETWFAIRDEVFSEALSRNLGPGDILSKNGTVARDHVDLLARFNPPAREKDYGLGALYVWPSGEIWFSVEEGFQDENLGGIVPGDLLSDSGYIAYRNLQLVGAFAPLEDLADFGLDAVYLVTDAQEAPLAPIITGLGPNPNGPGLLLTWASGGSVVQILRAEDPVGPYLPLLPIMPGQSQVLPFPNPDQVPFFLRLQQW